MNELKNIRILKSIIFSDIESLYSQIDFGLNYKVQVPNNLSHSGAFGIEGAVLQLFFTVMRNSNILISHTAVNSVEDSELYSDLCNNLLGLCALRLSDRIITNDKRPVDLKVALRPSIPIFQSIRSESFLSAFKGPYLALPSVKSPARKDARSRELSMPFYNNENLVGAEKFLQITGNAIKSIYPLFKTHNLDKQKSISNISEIIRELFSNTHRHARTDYKGNYYDKNVRAVTYKLNSLDRKRMQEIAKSGGGRLAKFIGWCLPQENEKFYALDITVIDSGPGFARRWTGLEKDQIDSEMEKDAVIECFKKHTSSASDASSGSGLSNVLKDLKRLNGWMRLRTGRTLVEKSFFNYEGSTSIKRSDIKMMEAFVEGATFNVVIPINALREDF